MHWLHTPVGSIREAYLPTEGVHRSRPQHRVHGQESYHDGGRDCPHQDEEQSGAIAYEAHPDGPMGVRGGESGMIIPYSAEPSRNPR